MILVGATLWFTRNSSISSRHLSYSSSASRRIRRPRSSRSHGRRTYVLPLVHGEKRLSGRSGLRMPVARVLPLKPFWTFWGKSEEKINNLQGSGHGG